MKNPHLLHSPIKYFMEISRLTFSLRKKTQFLDRNNQFFLNILHWRVFSSFSPLMQLRQSRLLFNELINKLSRFQNVLPVVVMELSKTSKFHWILLARSSIVSRLRSTVTIAGTSFSQAIVNLPLPAFMQGIISSRYKMQLP